MHVFDKEQPALKAIKKKDREAAAIVHRNAMANLKGCVLLGCVVHSSLLTPVRRRLRHPRVLRVIETFEENRKIIAFVSERVVGSLANIFHDFRGFPTEADVPPHLMDATVSTFEVAVGLLHVAEALQFCHRDAKRVHLDVAPWSIFVTPAGAWKLAGFGLSLAIPFGSEIECPYFEDFRAGKLATAASQRDLFPVNPSLRYCAPEVTRAPGQVSPASDMFSLGCLAVEMLCRRNEDGTTGALVEVPDENPATHAYRVQNLLPIAGADMLPDLLRPAVLGLLAVSPAARPDAAAFLRCEYFDRGPLYTLRSVQGLMEQTREKQAEFLSLLPPLLAPFPASVLRDMVLPVLLEFAKGADIVGVVVPPLMCVSEKLDNRDFARLVQPTFSRILTSPAMSPTLALHLLRSTTILLEKGDSDFIRDHLAPLVVKCYPVRDGRVSEQALKATPLIAEKLDRRTLAGVVLPQVLNQLTAADLSPRVNGLMCLAELMKYFDKTVIQSTVLPALLSCIRAQPREPGVAMCVVGCYDRASTLLGPTLAAIHVAPFLVPLLAEPRLNRSQLDTVAKTVHRMLGAVVEARQKALREGEAMTKAQQEAEKNERSSRLAEAKSVDASQFSRPEVRRTSLYDEKPASFTPYKDKKLMEPNWGGLGDGGGGDIFGGLSTGSGGAGGPATTPSSGSFGGATTGSAGGFGASGGASGATSTSGGGMGRPTAASSGGSSTDMFGLKRPPERAGASSDMFSGTTSAAASSTAARASGGSAAYRPPSSSSGSDMFGGTAGSGQRTAPSTSSYAPPASGEHPHGYAPPAVPSTGSGHSGTASGGYAPPAASGSGAAVPSSFSFMSAPATSSQGVAPAPSAGGMGMSFGTPMASTTHTAAPGSGGGGGMSFGGSMAPSSAHGVSAASHTPASGGMSFGTPAPAGGGMTFGGGRTAPAAPQHSAGGDMFGGMGFGGPAGGHAAAPAGVALGSDPSDPFSGLSAAPAAPPAAPNAQSGTGGDMFGGGGGMFGGLSTQR